jgi:hypothetical protein
LPACSGLRPKPVLTAYRRHGLTLAFTIERGDWPTLTMRKRRATGWR